VGKELTNLKGSRKLLPFLSNNIAIYWYIHLAKTVLKL